MYFGNWIFVAMILLKTIHSALGFLFTVHFLTHTLRYISREQIEKIEEKKSKSKIKKKLYLSKKSLESKAINWTSSLKKNSSSGITAKKNLLETLRAKKSQKDL